jgi:hypothetical protein
MHYKICYSFFVPPDLTMHEAILVLIKGKMKPWIKQGSCCPGWRQLLSRRSRLG